MNPGEINISIFLDFEQMRIFYFENGIHAGIIKSVHFGIGFVICKIAKSALFVVMSPSGWYIIVLSRVSYISYNMDQMILWLGIQVGPKLWLDSQLSEIRRPPWWNCDVFHDHMIRNKGLLVSSIYQKMLAYIPFEVFYQLCNDKLWERIDLLKYFQHSTRRNWSRCTLDSVGHPRFRWKYGYLKKISPISNVSCRHNDVR